MFVFFNQTGETAASRFACRVFRISAHKIGKGFFANYAAVFIRLRVNFVRLLLNLRFEFGFGNSQNDLLTLDARLLFVGGNFFVFGSQILFGNREFFAELVGIHENVSNLFLRNFNGVICLVLLEIIS